MSPVSQTFDVLQVCMHDFKSVSIHGAITLTPTLAMVSRQLSLYSCRWHPPKTPNFLILPLLHCVYFQFVCVYTEVRGQLVGVNVLFHHEDPLIKLRSSTLAARPFICEASSLVYTVF